MEVGKGEHQGPRHRRGGVKSGADVSKCKGTLQRVIGRPCAGHGNGKHGLTASGSPVPLQRTALGVRKSFLPMVPAAAAGAAAPDAAGPWRAGQLWLLTASLQACVHVNGEAGLTGLANCKCTPAAFVCELRSTSTHLRRRTILLLAQSAESKTEHIRTFPTPGYQRFSSPQQVSRVVSVPCLLTGAQPRW